MKRAPTKPGWYEIPAVPKDTQKPVKLPDVTEKFAPIEEPYNWVIPLQTTRDKE